MSNDNRNQKHDRKSSRRYEGSGKSLSSNPFKDTLKNVRAGPECLECHGPIDTRFGWSLKDLNGTHKDQRHGYLHPDCQEQAELKFKDLAASAIDPDIGSLVPEHVKFVDGRPGIRVPLYSEDEIEEIVGGQR